jgi:hypothetical protein
MALKPAKMFILLLPRTDWSSSTTPCYAQEDLASCSMSPCLLLGTAPLSCQPFVGIKISSEPSLPLLSSPHRTSGKFLLTLPMSTSNPSRQTNVLRVTSSLSPSSVSSCASFDLPILRILWCGSGCACQRSWDVRDDRVEREGGEPPGRSGAEPLLGVDLFKTLRTSFPKGSPLCES